MAKGFFMLERHADPIDEAAALASSMAEGGIAAARRANQPESHPDFDGETCLDCGDDIPQLRLNMGKIRCVACQSRLELKGKMQAKPQWNSAAWDTPES